MYWKATFAREVLKMQLTRRQVQIRGALGMSQTPDISLLDGVVAPRILDAMRVASARLRELGISHALVGALGVGAHGYPRATKAVDFLVGNEAFQQHAGGLVSITAGVPIQVGDVPIDPLSMRPDEPHLLEALACAIVSKDVPVAPLEALIYLKLKSPRRRDAADVAELLRIVPDLGRIRHYLATHAPALLHKFDELAAEAPE
jgi:hypothetical protein